MTRKRVGALVLMAVLAVSSVAVEGAAAAPPELVNKAREAVTSTKFTGEGGKTTLGIKGQGSVACEKLKEAGEVTGLKSDKATITLTGCEFVKAKCNTGGAKAGEIVVATTDLLVYRAEKGGEFTPAVLRSLEKETSVECGVQSLKVKGSVLLGMLNVAEPNEKPKLSGVQTEGVQANLEYEETEGGKKKSAALETSGAGLKVFGFTQSGLSIETTLAFTQDVWVVFMNGPLWMFEGGRLWTGEKAVSISNKGAIKIKSSTGEIKIECTGATGNGDIIGPGFFLAGLDQHNNFELTGCLDKAESGCEVISYANKETEQRPGGQIGPISVKTELAYPGNTWTRTSAVDILLPNEENGAGERVFVVLELKKIGAEKCKAEEEGKARILGVGGPAAVLNSMGSTLTNTTMVETAELTFPASPFKKAERWLNLYLQEPIELRWAVSGKEQRILEVEGVLTLSMTAMKFGWDRLSQ